MKLNTNTNYKYTHKRYRDFIRRTNSWQLDPTKVETLSKQPKHNTFTNTVQIISKKQNKSVNQTTSEIAISLIVFMFFIANIDYYLW